MIERASVILIAVLFLFPIIPMMGTEAGNESDFLIEDEATSRHSTRTGDDLVWDRILYPVFTENIGIYYNPSSDSIFALNNGQTMAAGVYYPSLEFNKNFGTNSL